MSDSHDSPTPAIIRQWRVTDDLGVRTLHDRTPTAGSAPLSEPQYWPPDLDDIAANFKAFWVVEDLDEIIGMVGATTLGDDIPTAVRDQIPDFAHAARLVRMRIAPEWQRHGIGRHLVATVLEWARTADCSHIVLDTTSGQLPAIALYASHGFVEVTRTMMDEWELVWMIRPLDDNAANARPMPVQ